MSNNFNDKTAATAASSLHVRLAHQLDGLVSLIVPPSRVPSVDARPADGKWTAREHLAHVARHQNVVLGRVQDILTTDAPRFNAYAAETDPEWPAWKALPFEALVRRLQADRAELVRVVAGLRAADLHRVGHHPVMGALTLAEWLEFFSVHTAHHLLAAFKLVRQ